MAKITTGKVLKAFNDLTGKQHARRNEAFSEGWHIADYWCGRYVIGKGDELVATVTRNGNGSLSIEMR